MLISFNLPTKKLTKLGQFVDCTTRDLDSLWTKKVNLKPLSNAQC